jgi:hypothetical protein
VQQDANGNVWAIYTDFGWIAKRHGITDREQQFTIGLRRRSLRSRLQSG